MDIYTTIRRLTQLLLEVAVDTNMKHFVYHDKGVFVLISRDPEDVPEWCPEVKRTLDKPDES